MNRKLKVYGVNLGHGRAVAAVTSQKKFSVLIGASLHFVQGYGCETENLEELEIAYKNIGWAMVKCETCKQWHKKERA